MQCPVRTECSPVALQRRLKLEELLSYRDTSTKREPRSEALSASEAVPEAAPKPVKRAVKVVIPIAKAEPIITTGDTSGLSKKAKPILVAMERRGIDFVTDMKSGKISASLPLLPVWLQIGLSSLLTSDSVDRRTFKRTLIETMRWRAATAASHVAIFTSLVTATGVAQVEGHILVRLK